MKIKLALLDTDKNYLERIAQACTSKYIDRLETHTFTDATLAMSALKQQSIDVFLVSETHKISFADMPARCALAYLSESASVESIGDYKAIYKYQKIEQLYKSILELHSDNIPEGVGINFGGDSMLKTVAFLAASGGVGASTMAATYAKQCAASGIRVLYLNLERFASTDIYFTGAGTATFSDIIYALKSKRGNLMIKLESSVRRDVSGACFFAPSQNALDMQEFTSEDADTLLRDIQLSGSYDILVVDLDSMTSGVANNILLKSTAAVIVSDGSETANLKLTQAVEAIKILEQQKDVSIQAKTTVLYNKFSNKTSFKLDSIGIRTIGGFPRFEYATAADVVNQLLSTGVFPQI